MSDEAIEALYQQALIDASRYDYAAAVEKLQVVVVQSPKRMDAQIDLAIFFCQQGQFMESSTQWEKTLELAKQNTALIALKNTVLAQGCRIQVSSVQPRHWLSLSLGVQDNPVNQPIDIQQTLYIGGVAQTVMIDESSYQRSVSFKQLEASFSVNQDKLLYFWGRDYEQGIAQRYLGLWQQWFSVPALNAQWFYQLSRYHLDKNTQIQRYALGLRAPLSKDQRWLIETSMAQSNYDNNPIENGLIGNFALHWLANEQLQFSLAYWLDQPEKDRRHGERQGQELGVLYRFDWNQTMHRLNLHWWHLSDSQSVSAFIAQSRQGNGLKLQWEVSYPINSQLDAIFVLSRTEYLDRVELFSYQDHSLLTGVRLSW